jgi:crotonobetainyl-CoA:carnitine CoA-transferase CaiB-like acyl-CoA transferase
MKVFRGLKVIEFASVLAGPLVGRFFAELGAQVIKIEDKTRGGDVTRNWKTRNERQDKDDSAYYHSANWGKESWFLNLMDSVDREKAIKLCMESDIVISNFKPSSGVKLGVDYDSIAKNNPAVIYVEIHSFNSDPARPAYDIALQAETGYIAMCGTRPGVYARMPVAMIDVLTAHQAKEAALIALLERQRTSKGSHIKLDLESVAITSLANQAANVLETGVDPIPIGTEHPNIVPYGTVFYSSDNQPFVLAIGSDDQFMKLCELIGAEELLSNQELRMNPGRVTNKKIVINTLSSILRSIAYHELEKKFRQHRIPYGKVNRISDILQKKPGKDLIVDSLGSREPTKSIKTIAFAINFGTIVER